MFGNTAQKFLHFYSDFRFEITRIVHGPVFALYLLAVRCAISATPADAATQFSHKGH